MNEPFDKHLTSNAEYWNTMLERGYVDREDIRKARNYYGKYSYAEQNEAVKRLNEGLSKALKNNPDHQGLQQFIASMTEASDEMIKDKVTSSFRDLDNVTDTDITLKAKKLGIPVEEFRNQFKLVKERIDTEKGRERRKKELDEMAWYNPQKWATSDYEKQRYINDPDASIIGKEGNGKWFNKGEAISDLAYGIAGGVADLLPGRLGTFVGPAIRGARDIQHKLTGSKYQKDGGGIVGDIAKDVGLNVLSDVVPAGLTESLPNFLKKTAKDGTDDGLTDLLVGASNYNKVLEETKALGSDLEKFGYDEALDKVNDFKKLTYKDIKKNFNSIKTPELKNALLQSGGVKLNDKGIVIDVDRSKVGNIVSDFWASNKPGKINGRIWSDFLLPNGEITNEYKTIIGEPSGPWIEKLMNADDIGKGSRAAAFLERGWKKYGGRAAKSLGTAGFGQNLDLLPTPVQARQTSKVSTDEREDIDWFKENYSRDWEAGFVPRGKDDDPIMKAYREWKEENKKPSVRSVMGGM